MENDVASQYVEIHPPKDSDFFLVDNDTISTSLTPPLSPLISSTTISTIATTDTTTATLVNPPKQKLRKKKKKKEGAVSVHESKSSTQEEDVIKLQQRIVELEAKNSELEQLLLEKPQEEQQHEQELQQLNTTLTSEQQQQQQTQLIRQEDTISLPDRMDGKALFAPEDFKVLFEATPAPYMVLGLDDPNFTIVAVNEAFIRASLSSRDMVGKSLFTVFPDNPGDNDATGAGNLRSSLLRAISTRQPDAMAVQKYDMKDPVGGYVQRYWTPVNIPVFDKVGKMVFVLHRTEDVTEFIMLKKKGMDQALEAQAETIAHIKRVEEAQATYHRLTTLLPMGIFHTTSSGELSYVNQTYQQISGYRWQDISATRKKWYECLPLSQQRDAAKNWMSKNPHAPFQFEYCSIQSYYVLHMVPEITTKTENPKGYLGYIMDITERKRAEEVQRKRAEDLAELDRTKTVFFSNISHELRTPLTLILGPAEDSLGETGRQALPPRQRERMEVIYRSAQRLLKLVNSSLDFTRLTEGRLPASFEPTDLEQFTRLLAELFQPAMEKAGLKFQVDLYPVGLVYVDSDLWQKILFNLLSNAMKYTLEGSVILSLRSEAGKYVRVSVKDTGVGIPVAELPHMFERFHRIPNIDGRSHEGAGIGLSLTHELVKLHGGTVEITSELGVGSVFSVILPIGKDHLPKLLVKEVPNTPRRNVLGPSGELFVKESLTWVTEPADGNLEMAPLSPRNTSQSSNSSVSSSSSFPLTPAASISLGVVKLGRSPSPSSLKEYRVLIAEDNADMRVLLRNLLARYYSVKIVPDGLAAWEATKEEKFDLVLSDLMMPKMDGFQLIKALRADEKTATLPVILLSARVDEESRLRGLHEGADDYITKPFSKNELLERVSGRLRVGRWRNQVAKDLQDFSNESERQKRLMQLITHELRNPLVGIKGNSEIVEGLLESMQTSLQANDPDNLLPKIVESLAAIQVVCQCCDYQKIICDDVLDLAKLKEQKMELHLSSFDPVQITQDAVHMLSVRAKQGDITLTAECKMNSRVVSGDATRLTQVLVNLLSNAIKFTPKGGSVTLTLQSPSETAERVQLVFCVKDTGMGMSEEQQAKIFSPFVQASSAIAGQYGGTGLGLTISKSLVELMGGNISVQSTLGVGSTFTATVYCGNVLVAASPMQTKQLNVKPPGDKTNKLQVLVADDSVINQKILKRMLETAGHYCAVANNGQEALNLWTQMDQVDVVLMDLNMPIMGGLEATKLIRQAERNKPHATPTLIIGLSGDNACAIDWKECGMNEYVVKPYSQRDLLDKISNRGSA